MASLLAVSCLTLLGATGGIAVPGWPRLLAVVLVTGTLSHLCIWLLARRPAVGRAVRIAVIGAAASAERLAHELRRAGAHGWAVVGHVASTRAASDRSAVLGVSRLGKLDDVARVLEDRRIDLLLMGPEAPRLAVFDEVVRSCLDRRVRLSELSLFYEEAFGYVPTAGINAAWFQRILHPRFRGQPARVKRAIDVAVAAAIGLATIPLLAVLALIIRRDGGPAFFSQVRVGEAGRTFRLYKLRTMRPSRAVGAQWTMLGDPRVTSIGHLLRRTHLDELPQVINVLRGDMSLVGPRPEQPQFVAHLEVSLAFYRQRQLVKPGLTGWAQVRAGYADSELTSAWKLAHDLYYVKHRSILLDLLILCETVGLLAFGGRPAAAPDTGLLLSDRRASATEPATKLSSTARVAETPLAVGTRPGHLDSRPATATSLVAAGPPAAPDEATSRTLGWSIADGTTEPPDLRGRS